MKSKSKVIKNFIKFKRLSKSKSKYEQYNIRNRKKVIDISDITKRYV